MPGRNFQSATGYRYGFNGKENDPETGTQDFGARIYNSRLGRFFSIDPKTSLYPDYSPYLFAGNKPICFIDIEGEGEGEPGIPKGNIIIIPTQGEIKSGIYKYVGGAQGNWNIIIANDMIDAYTKTKTYLGKLKADNIIISTHGSSENGTLMLSNTAVQGDNPAVITHKTVDIYDKLPETNKNKKELTALKKLSGLASSKGSFLINSCKSACGVKGVLLASSIKNLVGDKVNLIMSEAYVSESGSNFKTFYDVKDRPKLGLIYPTDLKMGVEHINYNEYGNTKDQQYVKISTNGQTKDLGNLIINEKGNTPLEFKKVDKENKTINTNNN